MSSPLLQTGLVIAGHGRHVWVETANGERIICHPRGKKSQTVVGDRILWQATQDEGTIEKVEPRRNLFYRQDELRTKSFAANLDQVLILIAAEPEFSESQLVRALIAAEAQRILPIIALNKRDLAVPFARAWLRLEAYGAMGYKVVPLALKPRSDLGGDDSHPLDALLWGKTTLVLGPSGAGKSTLINRLIPDAQVVTNAISMTGQANWSTEVYFREVTCVDIDTDGDGILNKFDLDSDGDGCSDAVEAGTVPIGTTAFGSTSFFNPVTTGANGFTNSLETATESGIYSGTYKYIRASSSALSSCLDTDGDGISDIDDIDDDNDGITDH